MSNQEKNLLMDWFNQSEGYVEFRLIGKLGVKERHFIAVEDVNEQLIATLIEQGKQEQLNVYFGVATRKHKSGKEEDVSHVPGLWLDIDPKHATYDEAMQVVTQLPTPPTAIISSGNGIHAYFKFNKPFFVNSMEDLQLIKELSKKLHVYTNADHTADLARLLRVPNSLNVKNLEDAKLCSLVEFTGATYSIDSFSYLKDVQLPGMEKVVEEVTIKHLQPIEIDELRVSPYIKQLIVNGPGADEDRSSKMFRVITELLKAQHTVEEIAFIFMNDEWMIREKINDRSPKAQIEYIERAINNALERLQNGETTTDTNVTLNNFENVVYEYENCYYEKDKRLSNFIFVPEERVFLSNDEYLKGNVVLQNGEKLSNIILSAKGLSSKKNLIEEIASTKISWLGSDKHVQYLKELFLNMPITEKHGVNKIGLHNNLFVTPSVVINHDGIVENSEFIYMPKLAQAQMELEHTINMQIIDDWEAVAKQILPLLYNINEKDVIGAIIGWHFVAPIAPLIRKIADNAFPQLMIWGTQSAGKTSTAQVFGKLFGNPEIRTCTRPTFSIIREVDLLNGVPLYLDEFRPYNMAVEQWKGLKTLALNAYKVASDVRGTQSQGTITYQLTAPIVWLGETSFEESNMLERLIITQLTPNVLKGEVSFKETYKQLNKLPLQYFVGGYIQWILNKIVNNDVQLKELYEMYKEMLGNRYDLHERPMSNIAIVLLGIHLFDMLAGELEVDCSIDLDSVIESQVAHFIENKVHSALQSLFKFTAAIIQSDVSYFKKGVHYEYNSTQNKLILAKDLWMPAIRKYIKEHDYVDERISDTQLENLLKENQLQDGFVLHASVPRTVGGKSTRSYVIDTQLLEDELDIQTEVWEERLQF